MIEAEVETGALDISCGRVLISFEAERETGSTREGAFVFLDEVVAHTRGGDIVEFDIFHAIKAALITNIPRFFAGKIVGVINRRFELIRGRGPSDSWRL